MTPDGELLRQYAEQRDDAAFAELVRRHLDFVYSVALRQANGDVHLAQDATQTVFVDLARKARSLAERTTLAGWLHTSARYAVVNNIRSDSRRRAREHEATAMQNINSAPETDWAEIGPLLDEAVGQLRDTDREAVLLRFFKNLSHQEVGAALGLGEDAARKRVDRALEKLREHFARRGVGTSSGLLAAAIAENSVQAAPVGLAARVTGPALAAAAVTSVTTGGLFLKILFMSTPAKLVAAAAMVIIAAAITWSWPHAKQPPAVVVHPALVIAKPSIQTEKTVTPPLAQVAPPVVAAVNPTKPSMPTVADLPANFAPRAKIAKDEMLELLIDDANMDSETVARDKNMATSADEGDVRWYVAEQESALDSEYCVEALPTINDDGDVATFTIDDATLAKEEPLRAVLKDYDKTKARARPSYQFAKVNGKWKEIERDQFLKPLDKNPFVLEAVAQDPFAK